MIKSLLKSRFVFLRVFSSTGRTMGKALMNNWNFILPRRSFFLGDDKLFFPSVIDSRKPAKKKVGEIPKRLSSFIIRFDSSLIRVRVVRKTSNLPESAIWSPKNRFANLFLPRFDCYLSMKNNEIKVYFVESLKRSLKKSCKDRK